MSGVGPGCVKTCTGRECAELFSLLASPDSSRRRYWFSNRRNRDGISTRKFCVGVFTQPGSNADLTALKSNFRFAPESGLNSDIARCPKCAMCGRLRVGKSFLHVLQHWSVQPCVRPLSAAHNTRWHKWVVLIAGST